MTNHGVDSAMGFFAGQVVRRLRDERNWTQTELAERLGGSWNANRISRVEKNKLSLTRPVISAIASVFEIRPERLYLDCLREQFTVLREGRLGELLEEVDNELAELLGD